MISASGILETSHRIPNLDYDLLMRLTLQLTRSMDECMKLYFFILTFKLQSGLEKITKIMLSALLAALM